jgi:hypothetical protein
MTIEDIAFSPHSCAPDWYAAAIGGRDAGLVEADALRIKESTLRKGYFAVCGLLNQESSYRLFLAPSDDVVAVARVFEVGTHAADYDPEGHARALREIAIVQERSPMIPFFADAAGFKARFVGSVTEELITFLEGTLSDSVPMMDADDGSITKYVRTQKGIHLWWD